MVYPKPIMTIPELLKMGFTTDELLRATKEKGQTFAWQLSPGKRGSTWRFDTEGLEEWRKRQARRSCA